MARYIRINYKKWDFFVKGRNHKDSVFMVSKLDYRLFYGDRLCLCVSPKNSYFNYYAIVIDVDENFYYAEQV